MLRISDTNVATSTAHSCVHGNSPQANAKICQNNLTGNSFSQQTDNLAIRHSNGLANIRNTETVSACRHNIDKRSPMSN